MAADDDDDEYEFTMVRSIGEGAFGKVYLVHDSEKKQYALKAINIKKAKKVDRELAEREGQIMLELKHENVLTAMDVFEDEGDLCIVTEYCENGDLSQLLEARGRRNLEEEKVLDWFRQMASGLQYLHSRKILHRDIKTPNVLFDSTWTVKLADLGLAKVLDSPNPKAMTFCGSPYYMSPEMVQCKPYSFKTDIWSLGVIVYEMATLERPFDATSYHRLVFKVVHSTLTAMPTGYSKDFVNLLSKMLQKDPEDRPSAEEIVRDKIFKPKTHPTKSSPRKETPTTKPTKVKERDKPPTEVAQANHVTASQRWNSVLQRVLSLDEETNDNPGDQGRLLRRLIERRKKKYKEEKAEAGKGGRLNPILAETLVDDYKDNKTKKYVPAPGDFKVSKASVGNINLSFSSTLTLGESRAVNLLSLVVTTLTQLRPKGAKQAVPKTTHPAPKTEEHSYEATLTDSIAQLQSYCVQTLDNDMGKFQKAYAMLAEDADDSKVEENLTAFLGEEKFALCGSQLMYCRNFEKTLTAHNAGTRK